MGCYILEGEKHWIKKGRAGECRLLFLAYNLGDFDLRVTTEHKL